MAEPITLGVGLIGAGATLVGAGITGGVGTATLAYNVYKDVKQAKKDRKEKAANLKELKQSYDPGVEHQPSLSYQKSGTEKITFSPDGHFSAVGSSASDWSCGTITYYGPSSRGGTAGNVKRADVVFGGNAAPPPYSR